MKENYTILHKQDPTLPKIDLLLLFMKGDSRIPDGFGWSVSIRLPASEEVDMLLIS